MVAPTSSEMDRSPTVCNAALPHLPVYSFTCCMLYDRHPFSDDSSDLAQFRITFDLMPSGYLQRAVRDQDGKKHHQSDRESVRRPFFYKSTIIKQAKTKAKQSFDRKFSGDHAIGCFMVVKCFKISRK